METTTEKNDNYNLIDYWTIFVRIGHCERAVFFCKLLQPILLPIHSLPVLRRFIKTFQGKMKQQRTGPRNFVV